MARKARFALPGVPQHVIQRGNNREPTFYAEQDYERYLETMHDAAVQNQTAIHAYVLMTNHVHILVTPGTKYSISHLMQDIGRKYVRYVNRTYRRTGTLWEGRYKASLIDSEVYLLTCMRYIEMNPVRANMVTHPGDYGWSSYRRNASGESAWVESHPIYDSLGSNKDERQAAYRNLFRMELEPGQIHDIRAALNQELVLGRDDFKDKIEQMTQRQTRPGRNGRPPQVKEESAIYYVM
jgi:putative transposase